MDRYNWGYHSEPGRTSTTGGSRAAKGDRRVVLFGGMVYVRGHAEDFNRWEDLGARGWAYAGVLPYFKRMEHSHGGEDGWRGTDRPACSARRLCNRYSTPSSRPASRPASGDRRLQWQQAGRLRPDGTDRLSRPSLVGGNAHLRPALKRPPRTDPLLCPQDVIGNNRATGIEVSAAARSSSRQRGLSWLRRRSIRRSF